MIEFLNEIDKTVLLWLNGHHSTFLDWLMIFFSAKLAWLPFYIFLLYLIIKKFKKKSFLVLLFVAIAITLSDQSSVHLFKNVFQRLRPCHQQDLINLLWLPAGCGGEYGFVSSHAANSFSLVAFLGLLFRKRWLTNTLIIWGILIDISRIYLAAHFLTDVIFGTLLGILTGTISYLLYKLSDHYIYGKEETEFNQKTQ